MTQGTNLSGQGYIISCPYTSPYDFFLASSLPTKPSYFPLETQKQKKVLLFHQNCSLFGVLLLAADRPCPARLSREAPPTPASLGHPTGRWLPTGHHHTRTTTCPSQTSAIRQSEDQDGNSSPAPRACLYQGSLHQTRDLLIAEAVQVVCSGDSSHV